ncbi:MAG: HpcH/HpaI aldolase family protein [Christensenellales bacterium]
MTERKDAEWLRNKLAAGEMIIGTHIFCGSPMLTELMASMDYDIVWIDMEHAPLDRMDVLNNVIAVRAGGACSLVRITWNSPALAKPILDMGPDILLFPNILDLTDAKRAVSACEYPPKGIRGYGPQRAAGFGEFSQKEYLLGKAGKMLRAVQIENMGAVADIEAIAELEGIDLFIVGPNDLSGSAGMLGAIDAPEMIAIYDALAAKLVRAGRPFGVSLGYDPQALGQWMERGAQVLFAGYDCGYVRDGARRTAEGMRALIQK